MFVTRILRISFVIAALFVVLTPANGSGNKGALTKPSEEELKELANDFLKADLDENGKVSLKDFPFMVPAIVNTWWCDNSMEVRKMNFD